VLIRELLLERAPALGIRSLACAAIVGPHRAGAEGLPRAWNVPILVRRRGRSRTQL
jgi:hypothetical protein